MKKKKSQPKEGRRLGDQEEAQPLSSGPQVVVNFTPAPNPFYPVIEYETGNQDLVVGQYSLYHHRIEFYGRMASGNCPAKVDINTLLHVQTFSFSTAEPINYYATSLIVDSTGTIPSGSHYKASVKAWFNRQSPTDLGDMLPVQPGCKKRT